MAPIEAIYASISLPWTIFLYFLATKFFQKEIPFRIMLTLVLMFIFNQIIAFVLLLIVFLFLFTIQLFLPSPSSIWDSTAPAHLFGLALVCCPFLGYLILKKANQAIAAPKPLPLQPSLDDGNR